MYAMNPIVAKIVVYAVFGFIAILFGNFMYTAIKSDREDRNKKAND